MPVKINGTGYIGTANNIFTDASGQVGIGTASPGVSLDITNDANTLGQGLLRLNSAGNYGTRMTFSSTYTNGRNWQIGSNFVDGVGEFAVYDATAGARRLNINNSGYTTITNQPKFWVTGSPGLTATTTAQKFPFTGPAQYDNASGFSDANDRYTAPVTGYYYIYAKLNITASAQTTYIHIYKNGAPYSNGWVTNNFRLDYWVNHIVPLNANDYVEIWAQTAAGTTGIDNSGYFGGYLLG